MTRVHCPVASEFHAWLKPAEFHRVQHDHVVLQSTLILTHALFSLKRCWSDGWPAAHPKNNTPASRWCDGHCEWLPWFWNSIWNNGTGSAHMEKKIWCKNWNNMVFAGWRVLPVPRPCMFWAPTRAIPSQRCPFPCAIRLHFRIVQSWHWSWKKICWVPQKTMTKYHPSWSSRLWQIICMRNNLLQIKASFFCHCYFHWKNRHDNCAWHFAKIWNQKWPCESNLKERWQTRIVQPHSRRTSHVQIDVDCSVRLLSVNWCLMER